MANTMVVGSPVSCPIQAASLLICRADCANARSASMLPSECRVMRYFPIGLTIFVRARPSTQRCR